MPTLVTVLRSGGRYDAVWVERLAGVSVAMPPPSTGSSA